MRFKASYMLTEREIRYAIAHSSSAADAARFLGVSPGVFAKYAQMYFDAATGKSLYELAKNKQGKYRTKTRWKKWTIHAKDIIDGKFPNMKADRAKEKFINDGIFADECGRCGYNQQRESDYKTPTKFVFKDGNPHNFALENVEIVCWNCFFLYYGDVIGRFFEYKSLKEIANTTDVDLSNLRSGKGYDLEGITPQKRGINVTESKLSTKLKDDFQDFVDSMDDDTYFEVYGKVRNKNKKE